MKTIRREVLCNGESAVTLTLTSWFGRFHVRVDDNAYDYGYWMRYVKAAKVRLLTPGKENLTMTPDPEAFARQDFENWRSEYVTAGYR